MNTFKETVQSQIRTEEQLTAITDYEISEELHMNNAMSISEGEDVYLIEKYSSDWWFVRKVLTKEEGYVPSRVFMSIEAYKRVVKKETKKEAKKETSRVVESEVVSTATHEMIVERSGGTYTVRTLVIHEYFFKLTWVLQPY